MRKRQKNIHGQLTKKIKTKSPHTKVKGILKAIQDLAKTLEIPIEYERDKIEEGWMGKQKGMLQVLWECGFIDPLLATKELTKKYTVNGKKDENGKIIEGSSLKQIVSDLPDFKKRRCCLNTMQNNLGCT